MRVAFAGTPEFALAALAALLADGWTVPLVLTQPDRPAGRGLKLQPSAVKQLALQHAVPVAQPTSLRLDGRWPEQAAAAREALQQAAPDVLVVAAYGLILPRWVLDLPRLGCLNIHASLLPRWRGAAPIHRAIEAGDAETGITIMQMDEGLDTGAMLRLGREAIQPDDSTASLHDRLARLGGELLLQALLDAAAGRLAPVAQPAEGVTYAHKIDKSEAALDWSRPAAELERRLRAFDPFPGAHFSLGDQAVKVWRAEVIGAAGLPGEVLAADAAGITVACGEQALRLTQLQRPGGKRVPAREFLAAQPLSAGTRLTA
ncbi:MAG: methionyl-tRNA formyltransferase [Burkholderiales bacterium]|nr:methionyl-tRNA formyltransferase [Burkholderiales bacterium]MBP6249909.1 methionyl-tRNA formyltransferase [Leptothrix sp. (in: b-proteobacteria)]MBP7520359.1 methionyl-tRNA formyltransferase [Leptothrix sp. (in: b-proteobacteria)]HQY08854.1 methionyl-tRNA formyltransferase [Burkholderiaceae bacterium]